MNPVKKIIFLDLDGTLLNDAKELTQGNRLAVSRALEAGHAVVIATGRPLVSALVQAQTLGLSREGCYIISYNGGEIYDTGKKISIYRKTVPVPYVRYIFERAKEMGLHCQTYDENGILSETDNEVLQYYMRTTSTPCRVVPDVIAALGDKEPVKMIVMDLHDHEKLVRFREETDAWCAGKLDRFFSSPQYLEHVSPGINKGNAIRLLCDYLKIPLENTIAAGDAENDITMLQTAAVGAAMANAEASVKAAADYVTRRSNNEDGVAEVIEKFMLQA